MDLRKLKTLVDLVSESNISELEITEADGKVRIVKAVPGIAVPMASPVVMAVHLSSLPKNTGSLQCLRSTTLRVKTTGLWDIRTELHVRRLSPTSTTCLHSWHRQCIRLTMAMRRLR